MVPLWDQEGLRNFPWRFYFGQSMVTAGSIIVVVVCEPLTWLFDELSAASGSVLLPSGGQLGEQGGGGHHQTAYWQPAYAFASRRGRTRQSDFFRR